MTEYIVVPEERAGLELDEFLCLLYPECNKGFVRRQVRAAAVLVDGAKTNPSQRLRANQVVVVDFDADEAPSAPVAPPQEVPILYEDDDVLVVDKPAGLAVEPERWARENACLSGALLALALRRSSSNGSPERAPEGEAAGSADGEGGGPEALAFRPRLVHRIDKDTSGVVLVAKNVESERRLRLAFDRREVRKGYLALVEGEHPLADGESETIELPIGPDARKSGRQSVRRDGKPSVTRVSVAERFRGYTLLRCEPLTGRTHQIRVHLAARGFPLAVDPVYGRRDELMLSQLKASYRPKRGRAERPLVARLTLHAHDIEFPTGPPERPATRRVSAPLPKDMQQTLKQLSKVRRWSA